MQKSLTKSVSQILKLTKKSIKDQSIFTDYYLNKKTNLYSQAIPLIKSPPKILDNFQFHFSPNKDKLSLVNLDYSHAKIKNYYSESSPREPKSRFIKIRKRIQRQFELPSICPLFNAEGFLIKSEFKSNFINKPNVLINSFSTNNIKRTFNKINLGKINKFSYKNVSMNKFKSDFFKDEQYKNLKYDEEIIFRSGWGSFINQKISELKETHNENLIYSLEKEFEFSDGGLNKVNLSIFSLKVRFTKISSINDISSGFIYDKNEGDFNIEPNEEVLSDLNYPLNDVYKNKDKIFEFNLPFNLLPLFYMKNINAFLFVLLKIISIKVNDQGEEIIEINEEDIYKLIKENSNILDFKFKDRNEIIKSTVRKDTNILSMVTALPAPKKRVIILSEKKSANLNNDTNTYDTKTNLFNDYNVYSFFWITSKSKYLVDIILPRVTFINNIHRVKINQFIPMELILYLLDDKFVEWEFYVLNYLFSFLKFRMCLKKLLSHKVLWENKNIFLTRKKVKFYSFNERSLLCLFSNDNNQNYLAKINTEDFKVSVQCPLMKFIDEYYILLSFDKIKNLTVSKNSRILSKYNKKAIYNLLNLEQLLNKFIILSNQNIDSKNNGRLISFNYEELNSFDVNSWLEELEKYSNSYINKVCKTYESTFNTNLNLYSNSLCQSSTRLRQSSCNMNQFNVSRKSSKSDVAVLSRSNSRKQTIRNEENDNDLPEIQKINKNRFILKSNLLPGNVEIFCINDDLKVKKIREVEIVNEDDNNFYWADGVLEYCWKILEYIGYKSVDNEVLFEEFDDRDLFRHKSRSNLFRKKTSRVTFRMSDTKFK